MTTSLMRIVTFLIIAPHKYSYLLTYLLTYLMLLLLLSAFVQPAHFHAHHRLHLIYQTKSVVTAAEGY